jgi:hypothetical protein
MCGREEGKHGTARSGIRGVAKKEIRKEEFRALCCCMGARFTKQTYSFWLNLRCALTKEVICVETLVGKRIWKSLASGPHNSRPFGVWQPHCRCCWLVDYFITIKKRIMYHD